ncbi:MAG: SusC/RagA family TonB-linked outer membrane protein, partial [Bacteroidetes bacterium]|nr:SusC/RagA family TonB-linked outer membrane protein [Bacteroidota bacterium]
CDPVYASNSFAIDDNIRLPGDYNLTDFNADGKLDVFDSAPYGYSTRPQNNYNLTLGVDYKGFSAMVQFYGVNNVTRNVPFQNFFNNIDIAYRHTLDHWSKDNTDATSFFPRWKSVGERGQYLITAQYFNYDASYVRLKNAELVRHFFHEGLPEREQPVLLVRPA